jgi:NAD(P)-dependent dehydrogenase (short-subunit alcohol dehydrogenase family)
MLVGMADVQGLNALVTGGGRGIGAAIAAALTRAGAHVTVSGRTEASLSARVNAGDAAAYFVADVSDRQGFPAALKKIVAGQRVDILVNNAGGALSARFIKTDMDQFQQMLDVNLMGSILAIKEVLPSMTEQKFGRIINVASTAGLKGYPYVSAYVASKHALLGLTRALAVETARTGVTVNAVCPGFTDTDLVRRSAEAIGARTGRSAQEVSAELANNNPMGRLVTPVEVADSVCWLAGRGAAAVTGAAIPIAGGEL